MFRNNVLLLTLALTVSCTDDAAADPKDWDRDDFDDPFSAPEPTLDFSITGAESSR